jgi:rod shape-determining protein MreC
MPLRFDQVHPLAALGIAAAAWLVVPVALKTVLRASFFELTAPAMAASSHVRDLQAYWSLRLHTNHQLIEAGRDLARVNASYALSIQQDAALRAEVARLERLLNLPPRPGFRMETARVVQRDFSAWWQRLVVRKGRNYGIQVGAPVVSTDGLVGRVTEVHAYTSVVELISSPGVRLAAFLDGDSRPVSYRGGVNPVFGPARGALEFVPLDIAVLPGEPRRLVTSGLGGAYPPGLAIGEVTSVAPSTDGLFKTGDVRLDPRLSELTEVTVLVSEKEGP